MTRQDDIQQPASIDFDDAVDQLGSGQANGIEDLEKIVNTIISTLPRLNRTKLRLEMEEMQVDLKQNPHSADLSEGLAKAQGYKDRLAEIYTLALREYKTRNRCASLLFDAYNVISNGKSADKRKGEATMQYPMMLIQLEGSETFMKEVEHVLQNVKSAMEAISRQVSIMQLQVQLGDVRRGSGEITHNGSQAEEFKSVTSGNGPQETDWSDF